MTGIENPLGVLKVIDTSTHTLSGGSTPALDITQTGVSSNQTDKLMVIVGIDSDPSFNADYAFNHSWGKKWDDSDGEWDINLTVNWDTDPGSSNDVTATLKVLRLR